MKLLAALAFLAFLASPVSAYEPRTLEIASTNPTVLEYYLNRPYQDLVLKVWCDGNLTDYSLERGVTNAYVEVAGTSCYAGVFSEKNGNHEAELLTNLVTW